MGRAGLEPATPGFSVQCSNSAIADKTQSYDHLKNPYGVQCGVSDAEKREILDKILRLWDTLSPEEKNRIRAILAE